MDPIICQGRAVPLHELPLADRFDRLVHAVRWATTPGQSLIAAFERSLVLRRAMRELTEAPR